MCFIHSSFGFILWLSSFECRNYILWDEQDCEGEMDGDFFLCPILLYSSLDKIKSKTIPVAGGFQQQKSLNVTFTH